ncbi:MAG: YdcF family protein [Lachnospiraceae bacterium]|nr:YdcF family protein [Lachnospiraceae bacterium]
MKIHNRVLGRGKSESTRLPRCLTEERLSVGERVKRLERSKGMQVFLWITLAVLLLYAVFAFLYSTVVVYASGKATSFLWFWPLTCGLALAATVLLFLVLINRMPRLKTPAVVLSILFWICLAVFGIVEAIVFSEGRKTATPGADYVIVLGAQVRGEYPTLVLNARIKAAAEYLKENPKAVAVASGGQGTGESISEAEAIRRGLVRLGISEERILLEDASTSTEENLRFSAKVIQKYEKQGSTREEVAATNETVEGTLAQSTGPVRFVSKKVVLVTNDFHVFRATRLAENLGYTDVEGLGATDFFAVTIQYYVREFFAITKEVISGNF